jgi:adenylate cyclase
MPKNSVLPRHGINRHCTAHEMAPATACASCRTRLPVGARYCHACGAAITFPHNNTTEYKQVTVLFVDVVQSMDIAAALGPERFREVMNELLGRSAAVVQRYGGIVDKFTGDGIMALFGAPIALEDHALRACFAALDIQSETQRLSTNVGNMGGVLLQLRVGLNSGRVIVGEIGSNPMSYTAIGQDVGMAQRMESVAPPGGVMLAEPTARLVETAAVLGELEMVHVKGAHAPVRARRLISMAGDRGRIGRFESPLIGREREIRALTAILDQSTKGIGCVVGVLGQPGIGKSRIAHECTEIAKESGIRVFSTFCESHASEIPFHAVARLLRDVFDVNGVDGDAARARVRAKMPESDTTDLLLLEDLLGIRENEAELPEIDPDARRRRLSNLLNAASLARRTPALYIVEDTHWIDDTSESMFAELVSVIPRTNATVLITYRPEYRGELSQTSGGRTISLAPLDDSQMAALVAELLGCHPTVTRLAAQITDRAAGNPFFAEEMVCDLAERGIIEGAYGNYSCVGDVADVSVPATLMTTIEARIDRLGAAAKRTLNAAAVIGSRFNICLLNELLDTPVIDELVEGELIDQVISTPSGEYAFRHPLIRTVAYESQLMSARADLHRRLAAAIERREQDTDDAHAALIAEHLEAAGDLAEAFEWHMRAATWSASRDIAAARMNWQRASGVADRVHADNPSRTAMQIAPRTMLCGIAWRTGGLATDTGLGELRALTAACGDRCSLAVGIAGILSLLTFNGGFRESSLLAAELADLVDSIGDPTMIVGLLYGAIYAKGEAGEMAESLRLAQRVIDLADGDPTKGNMILGSPLALAYTARGVNKCALGLPGWRADIDRGVAMARPFDPMSRVLVVIYKYAFGITTGALAPDATALRETAQALDVAEQSGDDVTLWLARVTRGITLAHISGGQGAQGYELLAQSRDAANRLSNVMGVMMVEVHVAQVKLRRGDIDGAIELSRRIIKDQFDTGEMLYRGRATAVLVESLLSRGCVGDDAEAQAAVDRLAAVPTDPGFVVFEIPLLRLRARLARAHGDEVAFRDFAYRYRAMATRCGFEQDIAIADSMLVADS